MRILSELKNIIAVTILFQTAIRADSYKEVLDITQFHDGKTLALFKFSREIDSIEQYSHTMPKALAEVIRTFDVQELHLTFTRGRWDLERWGSNSVIAPSGIQLWTWISGGGVANKWKGLTNALAGLFCASINHMDESVTSEPIFAFSPQGDLPKGNSGVNKTRNCASHPCPGKLFAQKI